MKKNIIALFAVVLATMVLFTQSGCLSTTAAQYASDAFYVAGSDFAVTRTPIRTPRMNAAKAVTERTAPTSWAWPIAMPNNTRFPVMLAVKTRPRPR